MSPEPKELAITCPCCEARVVVDVRTGKVTTWRRAGEVDREGRPVVTEEDWQRAHGRVSGRLAEGEDRFEAGLSRERSRERDLDDLFRRASDKALEDGPLEDGPLEDGEDAEDEDEDQGV